MIKRLTFLLLQVFSFQAFSQCSVEASIGVAKDMSNVGRQATVFIRIENFGTDTLTGLSVPEDLDAAFGAGNYALLSGPILSSGAASVIPNSSFDGSGDTQLVSGTLNPGATATVELTVEITAIADVGMGTGVYSNQVTASALSQMMSIMTSDLSDAGADPDPVHARDAELQYVPYPEVATTVAYAVLEKVLSMDTLTLPDNCVVWQT